MFATCVGVDVLDTGREPSGSNSNKRHAGEGAKIYAVAEGRRPYCAVGRPERASRTSHAVSARVAWETIRAGAGQNRVIARPAMPPELVKTCSRTKSKLAGRDR